MFKALYGFFNLIFIIILFKIFAPQVAELVVQLLTTLLLFLNEVANSLSAEGMIIDYPSGL